MLPAARVLGSCTGRVLQEPRREAQHVVEVHRVALLQRLFIEIENSRDDAVAVAVLCYFGVRRCVEARVFQRRDGALDARGFYFRLVPPQSYRRLLGDAAATCVVLKIEKKTTHVIGRWLMDAARAQSLIIAAWS